MPEQHAAMPVVFIRHSPAPIGQACRAAMHVRLWQRMGVACQGKHKLKGVWSLG